MTCRWCAVNCPTEAITVEKIFEGGREYLANLEVPILSLAKIDLAGDSFIVF